MSISFYFSDILCKIIDGALFQGLDQHYLKKKIQDCWVLFTIKTYISKHFFYFVDPFIMIVFSLYALPWYDVPTQYFLSPRSSAAKITRLRSLLYTNLIANACITAHKVSRITRMQMPVWFMQAAVCCSLSLHVFAICSVAACVNVLAFFWIYFVHLEIDSA